MNTKFIVAHRVGLARLAGLMTGKIGLIGLTGLTLFLALAAQAAALPSDPTPPLAYVDTTLPIQTGQTIQVSGGDDLQAAITNATCGDTIVLAAGATFTGNFTLPYKNCSTGWIFIQSSALSSLPEGHRVSPSQAALMPKIISPNVSAAIQTDPKAHHYRLIGLEIGTSAQNQWQNLNYGLIQLNDTDPTNAYGNNYADQGQISHDIVLDRLFIHGNSNDAATRGVALNGANQAVIDSYISDIHLPTNDSQAIMGWNGPGPFKIVNNYLEAGGENILFGGADPDTPNLIPSDIEIRHNYFFKPLTWKPGDPSYAGLRWIAKNLFELKNAQRVWVDGNVFENSWPGDQDGAAIVLKSANQDGTCTWCATQDVTFSNNIILGAAEAIAINGHESYVVPAAQPPSARRIKISNVLVYPVSKLFYVTNNVYDLQISHVTGFDQDSLLQTNYTDSTPQAPINNAPFSVQDSILERQEYGIVGAGEGTPTLNQYFNPTTWDHNLILNTSIVNNRDQATSTADLLLKYPAGTLIVDGYPGFAGYTGTTLPSNYHGFALTPTSVGYHAASDGKDIGVDFAALDGALAGNTPPPTPSPVTPTSNVTLPVLNPIVYPNPWQSDKHAGKAVTFSQLVPAGTIKIFTLSGHEIVEIPVTSTTMSWNLTNASGKKVGSGIYIYLITDGLGNKAKGKVAVIK